MSKAKTADGFRRLTIGDLGNCQFISRTTVFSHFSTLHDDGTWQIVVYANCNLFLSSTGWSYLHAVGDIHSKSAKATSKFVNLHAGGLPTDSDMGIKSMPDDCGDEGGGLPTDDTDSDMGVKSMPDDCGDEGGSCSSSRSSSRSRPWSRSSNPFGSMLSQSSSVAYDAVTTWSEPPLAKVVNPAITDYHDSAHYNVILQIKWAGHGWAMMVEQLAPDHGSLVTEAMAYVRNHPHAFTSSTPVERDALKIKPGAPGYVRLLGHLHGFINGNTCTDLCGPRDYVGSIDSILRQAVTTAKSTKQIICFKILVGSFADATVAGAVIQERK